MIPVLWSSCCWHQAALLSTPEKPEICFWTTFSISITHFLSCWQFQRWKIMISPVRWVAYPCLILSPPSAECFSFFCSSSPLPYLEICSCPFFFHFKQVLVGSFRQRSCHTFLFPANLKSLFCNFETPFRRFFGLGVHLSWHRAAHLGCLAQSSSSWSKLPSVTRVAQRSFNKLLPSQQDWAKVLQNCAAGFWDPGRRVWEQTASTPPHRPTQTCLLPAHIWQFWHIFRFTAAIQWD